jgi:hypothetical protein
MPSTVISSSAFASSGIALNSQSFTEDISGLVRASLTFTTTASRADEMSQLFYVDAPPPVWPDSIDRFVLQSQQLYMVNRTVDKFAGLVTIKAQYAGALSNAILNPRVSLERKSVSFYLQIFVARQVIATEWGFEGGKWFIQPVPVNVSFNPETGVSIWQSSVVDAYDYYSGNATVGVKRISFASVGEDTFSITPPSTSSLILGATSTSTQLQDLSYQWNPYPTGGEDPFPNSGYTVGQSGPSGQFYGGPSYDRSRSTVSLLGEFGGYRIATDTGIDFITPTVFVRTARFWLEQ